MKLNNNFNNVIFSTINSKFARNVAIVSSGTAVAQAINMVYAPIITRIYSPEAFGLLGVFIAIVGALTPVAALTYPIAIVLPKKDAEAKGLVKLSLSIALGIATIMALILFFTEDWFLDIFGAKSIKSFTSLIPLAMFFAACKDVVNQWLIRKKHYAIAAKYTVIQTFIINSAKVGFGWFQPVGSVLIVLTTLGSAIHAIMLWVGGYRVTKHQTGKREHEDHAPLKKIAKKYYDFPLYRAPQVFINAMSQSLPVLMLASLFSPVAAGYYTISVTVLGMPSQLIGKSVGDVFYPRISEAAHNGENLSKLIIKATCALALVGFAPFFVIILFGPFIFSFVFGVEWLTAGKYAQWLALFFFFNFINKPSVTAVPILGIQKGLLIYELFSTGGKAVGVLVGFYIFYSANVAVALFASIGAVTYIAMILWIIVVAKNQEKYQTSIR